VLARVQELSRALSQLRPEKTWFVTRGRGFDSRHLHCGTAQAYARAVICFGIYLGVRFVSSSEAPVNPLTQPRPPDRRLACRCRNFTLFLVAPLRAKGIPARARCGFAAYFNPGHYEDHQVCEYWNASEQRWQLVDAQLDEVWRARLGIDFDVLDVPRNQFLVAADAWQACRTDGANAQQFGISFAQLYGLWFIAGSLIRDLAALNKMEMLPWDAWGAQPAPNAQLDAGQRAFFDQLAALVRDPDSSFADLRRTYGDNADLRVPDVVHNSLLERLEPVRVSS
jgi:hypothetical protein